MSKQKQQSPVTLDFVKPIILAGVFLIMYALINGFFTLANTRIIHPSPSSVPASETAFVSTELIEMRAKVLVDAHEAWQTTNIFVEKGMTVQFKVLDVNGQNGMAYGEITLAMGLIMFVPKP